MAGTAQRVIKNTGYLYAKMGVTMFISLYVTRLILNSLGAADFGIYNIVGGAIGMLGFLNAAMAGATQRFLSYAEGEGDKEKQKRIFNVSVVLHLLIAFVMLVAFVVAGYFFFDGILNIPPGRVAAAKVVYVSLIVSTLFTIANVPYDAVMNAHENMRYYAIVGIAESLLKLAVAFACVYAPGDKLIVYGMLMAVIPLITLTVMKIYCHRHYEECVISPRLYWSHPVFKSMTSFAGWNFMGAFASMVSQYGMGIVLNYYWGTLLNAAQGIANQLSGQLMAFSNTMLKALNPVIAKSKGMKNDELMYRSSFAGCKYSYLLVNLFMVPAMIEMPFLLKFWLGNVPDWAVMFCRLQLLRSMIEQLTITIGAMISAQGNIKAYSLCKSFLWFMPILLTTLCFELGYPPYALYVVWILSVGVLGGFVALYYAHRICGMIYMEYAKKVLLPCLSITVLMFAAVILTYWVPESAQRLILVVATTTLTFTVSLCFFLDNEERMAVKMMLSGICKRKSYAAR